MTEPSETYEIIAIRYATVSWPHRDRFIQVPKAYSPGGQPDRMDYFVWVIRNASRTVIVDTGFGEGSARVRGRTYLQTPGAALRLLGVEPADVETVVLTHLHYDHGGNILDFPAATFHVQEREIAYATGPDMCHAFSRQPYDVEDVCSLLRKIYADKVTFHRGDAQLAPGIRLLSMPGHTPGLQSVGVRTARGEVILASDAMHFYDNLTFRTPVPLLHCMSSSLETFERLHRLAQTADHVVPGHDPHVMSRFPRLEIPGLDAVRLDQPPVN